MNNSFLNSLLLLTIFTGVISCKTKVAISEPSRPEQIIVIQEGNEQQTATGSQIVHLKKEPFSIRFFARQYNSGNKKFYSAQIAAFQDSSIFSKIKPGLNTDQIPCFELGSGLAGKSGIGYDYLSVDNEAHHYLFYENATQRRVILLDQINNYLKLEFPVKAINYEEKVFSLTEMPLSELYLAVLIDDNLNQIVDKGEITKICLLFDKDK